MREKRQFRPVAARNSLNRANARSGLSAEARGASCGQASQPPRPSQVLTRWLRKQEIRRMQISRSDRGSALLRLNRNSPPPPNKASSYEPRGVGHSEVLTAQQEAEGKRKAQAC